MPKYLLGSTFPLSLIHRQVTITPIPLDRARSMLAAGDHTSFWGHENTVAAAEAALHLPVRPATQRPAVTLTTESLPQLDGHIFREAIILSPTYLPGFRPSIGVEVTPESVTGWETLHILWV